MSDPIQLCDLCDGPVEMVCGPGREHQYRAGIELSVPDDFEIATCQDCGETYLNGHEAEHLEKLLAVQYSQYSRNLIKVACARAAVTQRELERAAGVTPGYFSHVKSGRKPPSLTLTRLLQAFAAYPSEVARHIGRPVRRHCQMKSVYGVFEVQEFIYEMDSLGDGRNDNALKRSRPANSLNWDNSDLDKSSLEQPFSVERGNAA